MRTVLAFIALVIIACMVAHHYHGVFAAPPSPHGTANLTIQVWSDDISTDGATATVRHVDKLAEFRADGTWEEVTDLTVEQKRVIAERLHVMLNNWVVGQGLEMPVDSAQAACDPWKNYPYARPAESLMPPNHPWGSAKVEQNPDTWIYDTDGAGHFQTVDRTFDICPNTKAPGGYTIVVKER
jgi:hypothetical protein